MGLFNPIGAELFDLNDDGTLDCAELGNYYDVTNEIADSVYGDDDIDESVDEDIDEDIDEDLDDHHDDGLDDYFGGDDF